MCVTCAMFNPFGGDWLHAAETERTIEETGLPGGDAPDGPDPTVQLEVGDTVNGVLDVPGDWDWFYVEFEAGFTYTVTMTPGTLDDPLIGIADAAGNPLFGVDQGFSGDSEVYVFVAETSGSGYIVADSFWNTVAPSDPNYFPDTGTYSLSITAVPTPPPPPPGTTDPLDSIDGTYTAPSVINVYFAPGGVSFEDEFEPPITTGGWSAFEIQQAELAFDLFENVANVTFNFVDDPDDADFFMVERPGDELLGYWAVGGTDVTLDGVTYTDLDGHGVFYADGFGWNDPGLVQGGFGFITLIHEIGHGMGLMHPHDTGDGTTIMSGVTQNGPILYTLGHYALNQGIYTTMTYNDDWQAAPHGVSPAETYGFQGTPMAFDVAILQATYGANMSYNTGDDTYIMPTANAPGTFYAAIWDAGGTDTIVHTGSAAAVIDLREAPLISDVNGGGYVSYVEGIHGGFTIAAGAVIENASGGSGADTITGNDVANVILGGSGNDLIEGGAGDDEIRGNRDDDTIHGGDGSDSLYGDVGRDTIRGGEQGDHIYGGSQDDDLQGEQGNDLLVGEAGHDVIDGGTGLDTLHGDLGNDTLYGGRGSDVIHGGVNDDIAYGGRDADVLHGEDGRDFLDGQSGEDTIHGGKGFDTIHGGGENDELHGESGNDLIYGDGGDDIIEGGAGFDTIFGNLGADTILGGVGNDVIHGGAGFDKLRGEAGHDLIYGGSLRDVIAGGLGNDTLYGEDGNDRLVGNAGNDSLDGGEGRDGLFGGSDNDTLVGGAGADRLDGGIGDDMLFGGLDTDTFVFGLDHGTDVIRDFDANGETIDLTKQPVDFAGLIITDEVADAVVAGVGPAALVVTAGGNILLEGVTAAELTEDDFLFAVTT